MPTDQEWADFKETNAREHGELKESIVKGYGELTETIARQEGRIGALEAKVDGSIRLTWALFLLVLALLGAVLASPFLNRWYG